MPIVMTRDRRRSNRYGRYAESLCAWHLRCRGYRILARRFRAPVGEIDLVARRGGTIAFVEVKARRKLADAAESLTSRQRRRIRRAAEWFIMAHPPLSELQQRFDLMLVTPWRIPTHMIDAWHD